jgi:hypothetical protein
VNRKEENPKTFVPIASKNSSSVHTCLSLSLYILVIDEAKDTRWTRENCGETSAGILEQSMGARNRVGIGLSY